MFFKKKQISGMEREIFEQADILEHILDVSTDNNSILLDVPTDIAKVVLVASGSSYNCARYIADLFGNIADMEARAIYSSEFLLKSAVPHDNNILYVFITQSGKTTDTNKALVRAKEYEVRTLCVTNKKDSTIWQASDYKIECHAGEERSIAATKSLTAQMLCLTLLVLKYASLKGVNTDDYLQNLKKLPDYIRKTYNNREQIKKVAHFLSKYKNLAVTADGISYALAKEVSLKVKETSYINTFAMLLGEFMHGHVAVLNNKFPLIYISDGDLSYSAIKNLNKIKSDHNPPICIIGNSNEKIDFNFNLNTECECKIVKSFCIIVTAQLLALETALYLKRNVDKPRGLNKVVV